LSADPLAVFLLGRTLVCTTRGNNGSQEDCEHGFAEERFIIDYPDESVIRYN
jgi:hypothetical protein